MPFTFALSAFSVEVYCKLTSVTGTQVMTDFINISGNTSLCGIYLSGTTLSFLAKDLSGNETSATASGFTAAINTPYQFCATWTGTTVTFAVNGVSYPAAYSLQVAPSSITIPNVFIGQFYLGTNQFHGLISTVSFYPTVLSTARFLAHYNAAQAITYGVTGPASGSKSVASAAFTVAPTSSVTDTVSAASSVGGDTITTSPMSFSSAAADTFTIDPSTLGPRTITLTSAAGHTITGSPFTYTAAVPFVVTGPSVVAMGAPSTFTYTPGASTTDVVTPSDGGVGGTFSPATLTFTASAVAQTTQYTPGSIGPITISGFSTDVRLFTSLAVTSIGLQVDGYVSKSGKVAVFGANAAGLTSNGNPIQGLVGTLNANPAIHVNGNAVQIGPPIWSTAENFVSYLLECGSVQSIAFTNAGTASYTAPTITATGVTFGTPVLAVGILSYTITSARLGLHNVIPDLHSHDRRPVAVGPGDRVGDGCGRDRDLRCPLDRQLALVRRRIHGHERDRVSRFRDLRALATREAPGPRYRLPAPAWSSRR